MASDGADPREEDIEALLAACDDALAKGDGQSSSDAIESTDGQIRERLRKNLACVQMLRQLWPKAGDGGPGKTSQLGRFQVRRELGRGGYGVVYLAFDPKLGREVALKVPRDDVLLTPALRERFRTEARAAAVLEHPNIVPVFETGEVGTTFYIAYAYCSGEALDVWLRGRKEPVPTRWAASVVLALAEAVQHAHDRGVLHRDMKPANVLLSVSPGSSSHHGQSLGSTLLAGPGVAARDEELIPKVADFGLAKIDPLLSSTVEVGPGMTQTRSGTIVGTPPYMAPEQASGRGEHIGPATDIYALGAILYELLTGRPPFVADSVLDVLQMVRTDDPIPPTQLRAKLPRDLETICLKCLEKDPRKRYSSASRLADDLRSYLKNHPISARPIGTAERTWKFIKRHPGRSLAGAAGALLLVAVGITAIVVQQMFARAQVAAERQRADDRIAAEEERQHDLRVARAESLVEALARASSTSVPGILTELGEFREMVRPQLNKLAEQPISTKAGFHARLALSDEPGRVQELTAYLPNCRTQELPLIRERLKPHAVEVAQVLWPIITDEKIDRSRRARTAAALAGLVPDDSRWAAAAPAVAGAVVSANPDDYVVWAQALEPVRDFLIPPLKKQYSILQQQTGPEALAKLDLTANLLARYAADRPTDLAELLIVTEPRHHGWFISPATQVRGDVVPLLRAELAKEIVPRWRHPPPGPSWSPVPTTAVKAIEAAQGMIHDHFAFVQAVKLNEFEPLATTLTPSGYRPVRVRPYSTPEGMMVAAVWKRDGVAWKFLSGATAGGLTGPDAELQRAGFQPVDVAGWIDPQMSGQAFPFRPFAAALGGGAGMCLPLQPSLRYAVTYEAAPDGKPVSRLSLGISDLELRREFQRNVTLGGGTWTIHCLPDATGERLWISSVWGPIRGAWYEWVRFPLEDHSNWARGHTIVDVSVFASHNELQCAAVFWQVPFDQEVLSLLLPAEHLTRANELTKKGWIVQAISVSCGKVSSVWHRPLVADAARDRLAKRQANAAAALMALQEPSAVWSRLKFSPDPSVRSYLIARLSAIGASPEALIQRFEQEHDVSVRRGLLIALGDYPPEAIPPTARERFVSTLLVLYRAHPDSGIHGAIDWLLRQWGQGQDLAAIHAEFTRNAQRPDQTEHDRNWCVNGEGQTYVIVRGPIDFMMGSPLAEPGRLDRREILHRTRIDRSYAIASREVTVAEFLRYRQDNRWVNLHKRNQDAPAVNVNWSEAAEYCNWLSDKAGIPPDQWCYVIEDNRRTGLQVTIKANHLGLSGYRLPTEAEWEFACRSGSVTARHYGRGDELLTRYGWCIRSAESTQSVGRLRPNEFGLFDMLGNAAEWVDGPGEWSDHYANDTIARYRLNPTNDFHQVLRGGMFNSPPSHLRSSYRDLSLTGIHNFTNGFRPARTIVP